MNIKSPYLHEIQYFEEIKKKLKKKLNTSQIKNFTSDQTFNEELFLRVCSLLFDDNKFNIQPRRKYDLSNLLNTLPNDSVVICPGDSPSRLKILFELLFGTFEQNKFKLLSNQIRKIKFVEFPLSGLKRLYITTETDSFGNPVTTRLNPHFGLYRAYITSKVPVHDENKLYILDYHFSEKSFSIFKEIYPKIKKITHDSHNVFFPGMLAEAEVYKARCIPKYDATNNIVEEIEDFTFCNLMTIYMWLLFQDVILEHGEIESNASSKIVNFTIDRQFLHNFEISWAYNPGLNECISVINLEIGGIENKSIKKPVVLFLEQLKSTTDVRRQVVAIPVELFRTHECKKIRFYGHIWNQFSELEECTVFELIFLKSFKTFQIIKRELKLNNQ